MRRTWLLVAVAVVTAAAAALAASRLLGDSCPVSTPELSSAAAVLVPAGELTPAGTVGDRRRPTVDAVAGVGGPFGGVLSGRFFDQEQMPFLVAVDRDLGLAGPGYLQVVDVPVGQVRWKRGYDAAQAAGGLVGRRFVLLAGGGSPALVSFDARAGEVVGCVPVPSPVGRDAAGGSSTLLTDQAGTDVVTLVGPAGGPVMLSRIDPSGRVRWQRRLGLASAGSVTVAGRQVVVSPLGRDPVRRADRAVAGGRPAPVSAYSLANGRPVWTYRPRPGTAVSVVDWDASSGRLVMARARGRGAASAKQTAAGLFALDQAGRTVWQQAVGRGYWDASRWGPVVVAQGADPDGGPRLRAFGIDDGSPAWSIRAAQAPPRGRQPRLNYGDAVSIGNRFVVPSPNGLLAVDPLTGRFERLDSDIAVQQVLPLGRSAVVRTADAILVVRLRRTVEDHR